jgi:hypothetical protein
MGIALGKFLVGTFSVKEGALYNAWTTFEHNVRSFKLHKDRVGWLTNSGTLKAKDGALWASTITLESGVLDFDLKYNQVALITTSSNGKAMLGDLNGNKSHGWESIGFSTMVSCGLD